jgi:hypothetical protein
LKHVADERVLQVKARADKLDKESAGINQEIAELNKARAERAAAAAAKKGGRRKTRRRRRTYREPKGLFAF